MMFPILNKEQAGWIMEKLVFMIKRKYYVKRNTSAGPRRRDPLNGEPVQNNNKKDVC